MNTRDREIDKAALAILRSTGISILDAALVAKTALEAGQGRMKGAMKCIEAGSFALQQQKKTATFAKAVEAALEARKNRRTRTVYDFRYFTRRFMKRCPELARRRVRAVTPQECTKYIEQAFDTPRQRQKARLILSGVFATAVKRGWCDSNPVAHVEVTHVVEQQLPILTPQEIETLKQTAEDYQGGSCAAAVGMMLYAGIRPHEVARLTWEQVDLQEKAIYILPRHSKTGGARRVSIHKPLMKILLAHMKVATEKICPPNWLIHWRMLRRAAGWGKEKKWSQDALRHTFASYHLSHFRSYADLQMERRPPRSTLLRTRYVDQRGVHNASQFWNTAC